MARLRDGFAEIASGWMLVDSFADVTDRIERLGRWTTANGGYDALTEDELATVSLMIRTQFVRGAREGVDVVALLGFAA